MPAGMPITQESKSRTAEPTIALPMPPPSPTGRGVSTRNRKLIDPIPRIAMWERMIASVLTANKVQSAVSMVITALWARRDRSVRERVLITVAQVVKLRALRGHSYAGCSARDSPHQHAGDCVDDKGNQEKDQAELDQRTQINVSGSFGEFVGNDRSQCV